ncbi:hypothetical protein [Vibrio quintilis]|uniref:Uncharacterized protein n=1 Tax=Vibrio quintilis TaxID=1117707 RepID=A0A1M7YYW4_9VIBR|nr:hypothetical protein [Vibrio quintilis]SHO57838.1 hypothetical protein VQ7734_03608 [Vibrio quintilis]
MKKQCALCILALLTLFVAGSSAFAATWEQQTGWVKVYQNDAQGNKLSGDIDSLTAAISNGADVKVSYAGSNNLTMSLHCEWTAVKDGYAACMNTSHISIRSMDADNSKFGFQDNAYHWYVMLNTEGKLDMSRWSVGANTNRGHTQNQIALSWWVRIH